MKLMTEAYTFAIAEESSKFTITLTEASTGKTKIFVTHYGHLEGHRAHMNSLTDDLCSSWFREKPEKKPKKDRVTNS